MRLFAALLTVFVALAPSIGCEKESLRPGLRDDLPNGSFIDEPIVLERSEPATLSRIEGDDYVIDMSGVPLIANGAYNDILISYSTITSCDEDVYILNAETREWEQIGYAIEPGSGIGCRQMAAEHFHLLSSKGISPKHCLDADNEIRLRGYVLAYTNQPNPKAEALRVNPDYLSVPLPARYFWRFDGLAYEDGSLWTSTDWFDKIYELAPSGEILREFSPPSEDAYGMASDGANLWLADRGGAVFKITRDGEVLCSFNVPVQSATGLAWGNGKLWLGDYGRVTPHRDSKIYGIAAEASCNSGAAIFTDELEIPGGRAIGLAWDGSHILVASDSLYKVAESGAVAAAYAFPVNSVTDIAWDGEAVWILNTGPSDLRVMGPVATRFRLP
jgi:hypothetical protein